jgi:hypothetical protein
MTESRLCGLALLYTHKDMTVYVDNVLRKFDALRHKPRLHVALNSGWNPR